MKSAMRVVILSVVFLVFLCAAVCAAQDMSWRYGVWGGVHFNMHSAGFSALPGIDNCCTAFERGEGVAGGGGVLLNIPLSVRTLVGIRAGMAMYSAVVSASENKLVLNRTGTGLTGGVIEHSIDAALPALGAEVLFGYRFAGRFTAYAGMRGDMLLGASFAQKETLLEPSHGTFENDSRVRNERSGDIPGAASGLAFALVGISYETPLNKTGTLTAAPEIMAMIGLTSLVDGLTWKANGVRVGLAITYNPPVAEPLAPIDLKAVEPAPEPVPEKKSVPVVSRAPALVLDVVELRDGTERRGAALRIEEIVITDMTPLLGYVFFGEGMAVVPDRYKRLNREETAAFSEENIDAATALDVYYHILNIVGSRMHALPDAVITLTGCTSEYGADRNSTLARRRAEAVREYLVQVWDIAPDRIQIAARGLPVQPSNSAHADGREENRRVEITTNRRELLRPVVLRDTVRVPYPPVLNIRPLASGEPVSSWTVSVAQNGEIVDEVSGSGGWPALVEMPVERVVQNFPVQNSRLTLTAKARHEGRVIMAATEDIPVEWMTLEKKVAQQLADKTIDRYSLLLFNFDDAAISEAGRSIVELVGQRITPASSLTITGYTDRTGDAEYNRRLSSQRAAHTARALGVAEAQVEGRGNDVLLFTNDLPEGRFYCRTVTITVETPVNR